MFRILNHLEDAELISFYENILNKYLKNLAIILNNLKIFKTFISN